ncbi:MAG: SDR family oxidoreductase [Pseudomonadales bacterium]|jgi:NAD(P)-dependent dehydrogenase (short-subunit alcohol dehydrogenase family)
MDTRLDGRTAVVTGGSLGLGFSMARSLFQAGARVAIVARNAAALEAARAAIAAETATARSGARIEAYQCDVCQADEIIATHARIVADLGGVDILVNNAGRSAGGAFETITDEAWQADLDLKLFAAIRWARLAWPHMRDQRWGRIINLLNVYAKTPDARTAPTSVSRAAGMALSKVLANEGAEHNILVNALLIGFIRSDQIRRQHAASGSTETLDEFVARAGARLPMGRMGEPEEVANLALFLASEAGSYVTGCAINMDGGVSRVV